MSFLPSSRVVLLMEGSSLTARETLTVLGRAGFQADVLSSNGFCIGRFSRWTRRMIPCPSPADRPVEYLEALGDLAASGEYAAIVPTHEQAWLIAEGRGLLPANIPAAVADSSAFAQVQSKTEFAKLLDKLHIPQPAWQMINLETTRLTEGLPYPVWVKAVYGTAGRGVIKAHNDAELADAVETLARLYPYDEFMTHQASFLLPTRQEGYFSHHAEPHPLWRTEPSATTRYPTPPSKNSTYPT